MVYVRAENTPVMHRLVQRAPQSGLSRGTPDQRGRLLWTRFCESCHGAGESGANSLKNPPPERVRRLVRDGNGPMPAVGPMDLDEQGMTWLLAYIANPAAGAGATIPDPGLAMPAGNPGRFRMARHTAIILALRKAADSAPRRALTALLLSLLLGRSW